ncbi:MAG: tetratricopeptide repeat protein, partial [Rhodospirillaceae bacterium]|nr:tetratricopeptide repeat protein [Rhodospirillaceae bacterium]
MDEASERYNRTVQHHRDGRLQVAETGYRDVLAIDPRHADALHMLGIVLSAQNQDDAAIDYIRRALDEQPENPNFLNNFGVLCKKLNRLDVAIDAYRTALARDPAFIDGAYNLANALVQFGETDEAIELYRGILVRAPENSQARANLAAAYQKAGRLGDAALEFEGLIDSEPDNAGHYNNLGVVLFGQGDFEGAICRYEAALQRNPQFHEALGNLGLALLDSGRSAEAETYLQSAAVLAPGNPDVLSNLATAYRQQGRIDEAAEAYRKAMTIRPSGGLAVRQATLLPVIPESKNDLEEARERFEGEIDQLSRDGVTLTDPYRDVGVTQFHLSYHDANNRDLARKISELYRDACPMLDYTAPHCRGPRAPSGKRVKVGFVSRYFRNHAVGWYYQGVLRYMARDRISVTAFTFGASRDRLWDSIAADVDKTVTLPFDVQQARTAIAAEELDVLVYTDIGMEPLTYFICHSRLAPTQCVLNGHPDTTGVSTLDYFISGAALAPPNAATQYGETLVNLDGPFVYYEKPEFPAVTGPRSKYALPDGANVYLCPQSLFKIHPDMDEWFTEILQRDRNGMLVLFEGPSANWANLLRNRWAPRMGDMMARVRFLPRASFSDFLDILSLADVILDSWPFGGGNTAYQAFAAGMPVVTLPSAYVRGRSTMALYHRMGVADAIAAEPEDYIQIALRLGRDKDENIDISRRIRESSGTLFRDVGAIKAFEAFLSDG